MLRSKVFLKHIVFHVPYLNSTHYLIRFHFTATARVSDSALLTDYVRVINAIIELN